MEYIITALLAFSIFLLFLSFFLKDPYRELKNEFEQFSMEQIRELYQIKRKLKVFEEELLVEDSHFRPHISLEPTATQTNEIHAVIKNQIWSLAQQGLSTEQIAKQSSLSEEDVNMLLKEFKGENYV